MCMNILPGNFELNGFMYLQTIPQRDPGRALPARVIKTTPYTGTVIWYYHYLRAVFNSI